MATQAQITAVQQLYVSYLGRAADKAGLDFWSNAIATGTSTIESVATGLTLATEYTTAYGNLSNSDLVDAVYTNVLGRSADAAGKAFWVAAFGNGTVKADTFVASLIQSLGAQDQATINNKTFVAQTYTDTVGDAYTPAGGAAVLVGVSNDPATVTAAIAAINTGTLPGQVPGLALINAVTASEAALTAFETSNTAAVDALVAKLLATDTNTATKALTATSTYDDKLAAIKTDAASGTAAKVGTVNQINATILDDTAALKKITDGLSTADKTLVANYDAAVAANAALKAPATADIGAAQGGLAADTGFTAALGEVNKVTLSTGAVTGLTTAKQVYDLYVKATTTDADRALLDTALKGDAYASSATFKATAAADTAKFAAVAKEDAATTAVNAGTTSAGYVKAATDLTDAKADLVTAQAADANQTSADSIAAAQKAQEDKVAAAEKAIDDFNAGSTTSKVLAQSEITKAVVDTAKQTFYFDHKVTTADDFAFASKAFGAGDSLVVGSGFTFNSGALSTGDNNKAEFFLVQKGSDTLVVLETANFGSSTTLHTATGDTAAVTSNDAAVITLTGVALADVTVNNGVISHVA